ncbi:MAG: hypothetical protein ACRC6V_13650 [Bacteroidales bacterium]
MDLGVIYNLLQKAQNLDEFMMYNNIISQVSEENELMNSRECGNIEASNKVKVKNKILNFINSKTKTIEGE